MTATAQDGKPDFRHFAGMIGRLVDAVQMRTV
jgi:hypothetical protein